MRTFIAVFLLLHVYAPAQHDEGVKALFHVSSVSYGDDPARCPTDTCTAKRYNVEGYVNRVKGVRIEYRLKCDEVTLMEPRPHVQFACADVHANNDYNVRIHSFGLDFWKEGKDSEPYESIYEVVSEREVRK